MITKDPWRTYKQNKQQLWNLPIQARIRNAAESAIQEVGADSGMWLPRLELIEQKLGMLLGEQKRLSIVDWRLDKANKSILTLQKMFFVMQEKEAERWKKLYSTLGVAVIILLGLIIFL